MSHIFIPSPSSGGTTIGGAVTSGTPGAILFIDAAGNLGQSVSGNAALYRAPATAGNEIIGNISIGASAGSATHKLTVVHTGTEGLFVQAAVAIGSEATIEVGADLDGLGAKGTLIQFFDGTDGASSFVGDVTAIGYGTGSSILLRNELANGDNASYLIDAGKHSFVAQDSTSDIHSNIAIEQNLIQIRQAQGAGAGDLHSLVDLNNGGVKIQAQEGLVATTFRGLQFTTSEISVLGDDTSGGSFDFREISTNGNNYVRVKAPDTVTTNRTIVLPSGAPVADYLVGTDGSGNWSYVNPVLIPDGADDYYLVEVSSTSTDGTYVGIHATDAIGTNVAGQALQIYSGAGTGTGGSGGIELIVGTKTTSGTGQGSYTNVARFREGETAISAVDAFGTNQPSAVTIINSGAGTGNDATNGYIDFSTSDLEASGTTLQTLSAKARVTKSGDFLILDNANGVVLKDNAGTPHYWRISVSSLGALSTTDIGTNVPN